MRPDLVLGLLAFYGIPLLILVALGIWKRDFVRRMAERVSRYFKEWADRDKRVEEIQRRNAEEEAHWRKVAEVEVKKMTDPDDDEGEVKQSL